MPMGSNVVVLGSADGILKSQQSSSLWPLRFVVCKRRRGPSKQLGLYGFLKKRTHEKISQDTIHKRIEFNEVLGDNLLNRKK